MKWLDKLEEGFIAISLFIATIFVFVNVLLRFFSSGLSWSEELIRYLLIWVTFIGCSICVREGSHISIDFFLQMVKKEGSRKLIFALIYIIATIFSIVMTILGVQFIQFSYNTHQVSPALHLPMYVVFYSLPLSGALMVIRYVQKIIQLRKSMI